MKNNEETQIITALTRARDAIVPSRQNFLTFFTKLIAGELHDAEQSDILSPFFPKVINRSMRELALMTDATAYGLLLIYKETLRTPYRISKFYSTARKTLSRTKE